MTPLNRDDLATVSDLASMKKEKRIAVEVRRVVFASPLPLSARSMEEFDSAGELIGLWRFSRCLSPLAFIITIISEAPIFSALGSEIVWLSG